MVVANEVRLVLVILVAHLVLRDGRLRRHLRGGALHLDLGRLVRSTSSFRKTSVPALDALPAASRKEPKVRVCLDVRPKCKQIAKLSAVARRPAEEVLIPARVIRGPNLPPFVDLIARRARRAVSDNP